MVWFTSDLHFFHDRILEFHPKRKELFGKTVQEAKEKMIQLWNSTVNKKDTVYILGDLAFGEIEDKRKLFQRLNGNKVLILGNHDKVPDHLKCYFNSITQIKNMKFKKSVFNFLHRDLEIVMCHFPMLSWEHKDKDAVMLHGHCHGKIDKINEDSKELRFDVGIDGKIANYKLISLEKVSQYIKKIEDGNNVSRPSTSSIC
jgi:calcineurin-like phosphoesterase family protein